MRTPSEPAKSVVALVLALEGDAPIPDSIEPALLDRVREVALNLPAPYSTFLRLDLIERHSPETIMALLGLHSPRIFQHRKLRAFAALRAALRELF